MSHIEDLHTLGTESEHDKRFKRDLERELASVMASDPTLTAEEALRRAQENLMVNNPYVPIKNGVCIINTLPVELLAHIFRVGVEMQREGDEEEDLEPVDQKEEKASLKEGLKKLGSAQVADDEDEDDDSSEEDVNPNSLPTDDNDPEWEDEEAEGDADDEEESDEDEEMSSDDGDDEEDDETEVPFEILVSHICRHWRETAINAPDLWSSIYIDQPHQWSRYESYLERSKGQPLDLDITLQVDVHEDPHKGPPTAEESLPDVKRVVDLVMPKAEQWRSLALECDYWLHAREFLKRMAEVPCAPHLERLYIDSYEESTDDEVFEHTESRDPFYLPFHGNAPNLQFVRLTSVHIDWDGAIPMFQGLQELELSYHAQDVLPSWRAFSSYLKNSPQLLVLVLHQSGPKLPDPSTLVQPPMTPATGLASAYYTAVPSFDEEDSEDPHEWPRYPLEVPSLRELELSSHEAPYALALLTKLHFPNLKALSLDYEEGGDWTQVIEACSQPLRGVNSRRSLFQTIESLGFKGMGAVRSSMLQPMLEALSGLKHLRLRCHSFIEEDGGISPAETIWTALSKNAKEVRDALKAKRANQGQSMPQTPVTIPVSSLSTVTPSAPSSNPVSAPPLSIIPPSPSAPLPSAGAGIESAGIPLTAQEELDSLNVKLLLPHLEGLRTSGVKGNCLKRFMLRRLKIGAPLKTLGVNPADDLTEEDEQWMEEHLESFGYLSDSGPEYSDFDDVPPPYESDEDGDPDEDEDDEDDDDEDGEWQDTDGDDDQGHNDDGNDDDDDDDAGGDDGEGGGRVQTRRGPSARATRRGAASMHVTTGLATLD